MKTGTLKASKGTAFTQLETNGMNGDRVHRKMVMGYPEAKKAVKGKVFTEMQINASEARGLNRGDIIRITTKPKNPYLAAGRYRLTRRKTDKRFNPPRTTLWLRKVD